MASAREVLPPLDRDGRLSLEPLEVCLIKGLFHHVGLNQQQIIAYFSFPERTINHNVVSEVVRNRGAGADPDLGPSTREACERFMAAWDGRYTEHRWAVFAAYAEGERRAKAPFRFTYRYHPVGQGLFCSGELTRPRGSSFRWVYDCGTEHGRSSVHRRDHVRREIDRLVADQTPASGQPPHLDLVTLSHFDEDHLSGILDLLSAATIGTLLLPHVLPWDRLLIALIEGAAVGSDLLDFLLAPTRFLLERAEGRVERIILVGSGGEGPALPPAVRPDATPPIDEEDGREIDVDGKGEPPDPEQDEGGGADPGLQDPRVCRLARGGAITVGRAWEFVPYNDARLAGQTTLAFRAAAREEAAKLDRSRPSAEREAALDSLIQLFDRTFKSSGSPRISPRRRNEISLFLYSGPVGRVELIEIDESILRHRLDDVRMPQPRGLLGGSRFGQMLTGDGYLRTKRQWDEFQTFFARYQRLYRSGVLQVMHHGAEANWRAGLAAQLSPRLSIFCSDPAGHNRHPRPEVLADFSSFNPKQVDAFHGLCLEGAYRFV